jgi:hypothetical protein
MPDLIRHPEAEALKSALDSGRVMAKLKSED